MSRLVGKNCANPAKGNLAFANAFCNSGNFSNGSLTYDAKGWPVSVTGSQTTATQLFTGMHDIPAGAHTMTGKGTGTFRLANFFTGAGTVDAQGRRVVPVVDNGSGWSVTLNLAAPLSPSVILFEIIASTPDTGTVNHLRDLDFRLPDHDRNRVMSQQWLDMNSPYSALRFLDWSVINGNGSTANDVTGWDQAQRSGGPQFSFSMRGGAARPRVVCEEYQLAAISEIYKYNGKVLDWWVQAPQGVTQDWCDGLANLCAHGGTIDGYTIDPLPPGSRVLGELSNETWNNFSQTPSMDADRTGRDAAIVAAWVAAHPGKVMFTDEYIAHRKAYFAHMLKDAFGRLAPSIAVKTVVVSQLGVPARGQNAINQFALDNLFNGVVNEPIDMFGAAFYFNPGNPSGFLVGLDLKPAAAQWATGDATAKAAALDTYFAAMPKCFADNATLIAQYVAKAAAHNYQVVAYEIGEQSNAFVLQGTQKAQMQGYLQACKSDPRYETWSSRAVTAWPDNSGPLMWFNDCQDDPNFGWRTKQWPSQSLAECPAERALLALVQPTPSSRVARRWKRGLMRLQSTTP